MHDGAYNEKPTQPRLKAFEGSVRESADSLDEPKEALIKRILGPAILESEPAATIAVEN
jgi:hypothetical protein